MLDGSENEVAGLLAHLFATEDTEPLRSKSGKLLEPEKSPEVLAAVEKAKAAHGKPEYSDAFGELMDTPNADGETPKKMLAVIFHNVAKGIDSNVDHADAENAKQNLLIYAAKSLSDYDPKKSSFNGWLHSMVRDQVKMVIRAKKRHKSGSLGGGDDEIDVALDLRRPSSDLSQSWDFTPDESKLCDWLTGYLTKIKDGTEDFPYNVKASMAKAGADALPTPEDRAKLRRAIEHGFVVAFMHNNGIGLPKLNYKQIDDALAKYGMGAGTRLNATKQAKNDWYQTMWQALKPLVYSKARLIGIDGDPEQVFDMFKTKLQKLNSTGAARGRTACEDDLSNGLYDLLDVLENFHEPANG
jgi:hypothetical protein